MRSWLAPFPLDPLGGLRLALDRLQLDRGVDLSPQRDTASVSLIYSF